LSPAQMLARRPVARELGQALDVLVELFGDGDPLLVTVVADQEGDDGRVFTHTDYDTPGDFWWEKSLSWMLATRFLSDFAGVVEAAAPVVAQLYHGQRLNPDTERRHFELRRKGKPARFWELFHDPANSVVSTREGKVGAVGAVETRRYDDPARAAGKAAKLIAKKEKAGYRETTPASGRPDTP
ncbi:WGR domain-containing protein, partial [Streptomyces mirabilis]